ncbi:NAD-binding protein [Azohydromonas sp. G-1-1-14]|uniref:NAD-binding protein n=1 Tax=Azohydromonas caseinilytica TaxID=2728836 RepID=A0A848FBQ3_9BURK|nr:NAD-binding protein [Azohydromonas caseinilytica]
MKICVLGAGALGCAIGGVLAEGGCEVALVTRNAAHVDAMNRDGLRLVEDGVERSVKVRAVTGCTGLALVLHALVNDILDRRLRSTGGNRPVLSIPLPVIDEPVGVALRVADEAAQRVAKTAQPVA